MVDNAHIAILLASQGASDALRDNVRRTLRSLSVGPRLDEYEMTHAIQASVVNWVIDNFYGNEEFPYSYAPSIARSLEKTVEEQLSNELYDNKLVQHIQSQGSYVKSHFPQKSVDGEDVHWSVFPRFYVVPKGYPVNNIEEMFAKLVGWQMVGFQQGAHTLGASYAERLNAVSNDWLLPEYTDADFNYWSNRTLYMNDCDVVLQQAEGHCISIAEEYLIKFMHEANAFTDNVHDRICAGRNLLEDYRNMQIHNAVCNVYGFARAVKKSSADELQYMKSIMLTPGDDVNTRVRQINMLNSKRCGKIDWSPAFNWLGVVLSASLSMFIGCNAAEARQIQQAASDPSSTGTPPPFNHVFFGKHKVFDLSALQE